ncbi:MAG: OmpH family outer membrane protein [Thermaurantimonas sp.]|uniref:OmpH family outer membrane protein n=1 Tax=Thermaurantimonas sp. TaxID=2681568 RepID=UPI00391BFCB2
MFRKTLLAAIVALFTSVGTYAQKFAHLDFTELVRTMPEYKQAQEEMEKMRKEMEDELLELQNELREKAQKFEKEAPGYTELVRQRKIRELQEMQQKIQEYAEENQENLARRQQELLQPLTQKAQKAIEEVATKNGYTYVFDSSQGNGLLFFKNGEDIIALVRKQLESMPSVDIKSNKGSTEPPKTNTQTPAPAQQQQTSPSKGKKK